MHLGFWPSADNLQLILHTHACRDDARNVLVAMMAELGAQYLYYAIQVLQNACPAKGYTAHVLGYTLHSILNVLAQV